MEITYPSDGDTFPTGSSFTIMVTANDDQAIDSVTLFSNDAEQSVDGSEPYGWDVDSIPAGTYSFHVVAVDTGGNETLSNTVTIEVGDDLPPPDDDGGGGDDGGGDDGGGDDGGGDGGDGGGSGADDGGGDGGGDGGPLDPDDDDSLPPGFGQDFGNDDTAGCGCRNGGSSEGGLLGLFGLLMLGSIRRRRVNTK